MSESKSLMIYKDIYEELRMTRFEGLNILSHRGRFFALPWGKGAMHQRSKPDVRVEAGQIAPAVGQMLSSCFCSLGIPWIHF